MSRVSAEVFDTLLQESYEQDSQKAMQMVDGLDEEFDLSVNESTYVAIGDIHRIANPYDEPAHIIEVQCGEYLGEDDIVRFEDKYGREGTNT